MHTNLVAERPFLDNSHADVQNIFHQLLTSASLALLLLLIIASSENSHAKHIQTLRLDGDTNNLAVALLAEALLEQSRNHSLQFTLDTALQNQGGLLVLNACVVAAGVCRVDSGDLLAGEKGL